MNNIIVDCFDFLKYEGFLAFLKNQIHGIFDNIDHNTDNTDDTTQFNEYFFYPIDIIKCFNSIHDFLTLGSVTKTKIKTINTVTPRIYKLEFKTKKTL